MKRWIALILVCLLCATAALAEEAAGTEPAETVEENVKPEWAEGRSAAQPYAHVPEVNLNETMGYIVLYPSAKMPADLFCDVLEIYLPREDLALGEGSMTLYDANGEVQKVSIGDDSRVELRDLETEELEGLMWGGGKCVEIHLPISLTFGESYYVTLEPGFFTAADGKLQSLEIREQPDKSLAEQAWTPVLNGDFGVSDLFYSEPAAEPDKPTEEELEQEEAPEEDAEPTAEPEVEETPAEPKLEAPVVGDEVHFDLVLGGDAVTAVVYSQNDSIFFEQQEYSESAKVSGTITGDEPSWTVVFLNASDEVLDVVGLD